MLLMMALLPTMHGLCQQKSLPPVYVYSNTFTSEQGLSQNSIACITKDRDDFIWIGSADGLNRFDGYSFKHFSHSDQDSTSLSNDVIRNLLVDSKGRLWAGTYSGLNLYDSEKENFRQFLASRADKNTISQNTILCLLEDRHHNLWAGTYWGLNKINLETFEITRYFYRTDGTGLSDNAVTALLEDRNGKIWVCTAGGINIIGAKGIETTIRPSTAPDGLTSTLLVNVVQDSTGTIYFGSNGGGVLCLENEEDRTFEYFVHVADKPSLGSNIISSIAIDRNGVLLVGTDGAGLYRYEGNNSFTQILTRETRILHNGSLHGIYVDDQNNYWVGLFGAGVTFISGARPRFEHYRYFDENMESIGKNSVLAITEDHDHKIWIGTDGAGLYKFDPVTKQFTPYLHSPKNKNSISTNVAKSLLVDSRNNLYIGTFAGGLNYFDTKSKTFSRYLHIPGDTTSISTNHVWSLLEDDNRIYVGQLGGLDEFLPESKVFNKLVITGSNTVTTQTASVFCIRRDRQGYIWMGTRLAGIHRYDPRTRTFKSFLNIPGDSLSMPTNEIIAFSLDAQGKLLVGTDNKGLLRFDPETLTYTQLLPDFRERNITSVLEDDSHNLWFTTFDGLHRYDPKTDKVFDFTVADGLQGVQYNEDAKFKSSAGDYYFGGTNGLNVFRPEKVLEDHSKPRVVFTKLSLFHDAVQMNDKTKLLTKSISKLKTITFQPDQNVFSIEFACLEYKFPKKNKYRYYLEGFDNGWNNINESRIATYTNLPPGGYTLKVSATNGDGYWNDEAASIEIIVIPRWHQRLGVKVALAMLLVVFTMVIIHIRTNFLFQQKRKLEHLVTLRTQVVESQKEEIKDKNEKLEQAYEEVNSVNEELQRVNTNLEKLVENRTEELKLTIKQLIETDKGLDTFLYRSSHDLRGPITSLLGLARLAKMQNQQTDLDNYFANIEGTAGRMLRLLGRLSDTGSLFRTKRNTEIIHADEFIQTLRSQINSLNTNNAVHVEIENKIGVSFEGDSVLLNHIVINLMENSIIFRKESEPFVKCILSQENQQLVLQVIDNGIGIPEELRDRIFDMFYRGSEKSIGNGLGLFITKKALEILGGTIEIESERHKYTTVTVRIPLNYTDIPSAVNSAS
ncbi:two-component regulator propeller domain-containing protein [Ohtaekwangia kribbensis]|jgi:ligand-binding sensor domain-containing protein/signal transduction histidine kinase|uniref:histidine kinase n=1 Tax=Ohtaekwangia kribbensis TaxID=688913 RepID=A0ABW3K0A0_9BACT